MTITLRLPNRSDRLPAVSSNPAKTRMYESRIHWMSCALAPRSAVSGGIATESTMLSITSTSVLRHSTTKISQRRESRACIRPSQAASTSSSSCEHCTQKRRACATGRARDRCGPALPGQSWLRVKWNGQWLPPRPMVVRRSNAKPCLPGSMASIQLASNAHMTGVSSGAPFAVSTSW